MATQPWNQVVMQKGVRGWVGGGGEQTSSIRDEKGHGCGCEVLDSDQAVRLG